jgi:hypothetical protein
MLSHAITVLIIDKVFVVNDPWEMSNAGLAACTRRLSKTSFADDQVMNTSGATLLSYLHQRAYL